MKEQLSNLAHHHRIRMHHQRGSKRLANLLIPKLDDRHILTSKDLQFLSTDAHRNILNSNSSMISFAVITVISQPLRKHALQEGQEGKIGCKHSSFKEYEKAISTVPLISVALILIKWK